MGVRRRALLVVPLLAVGCTAEPTSAPGPAPATSSATAPAGPGSTRPPDPPPRPRPLTIAVAGDVHFEGVLRERLSRPATALAPVTGALAAADLAVVNLETSVGRGGRPVPGKRYTFQDPPTVFAALAAAGIDVATMANNHALDFGRDPLAGMFAAADRARRAVPPLDIVGIGRDVAEAFRPAFTDVDGTVVATLGASVADQDPTADPSGQGAATVVSPGTADALDPARLLAAVRRADRTADVVVAYLHWGVQGQPCPSDDQRTLAAGLVRAGADVVVGSHAHLVQGDGRLGPGYVAYGLGNYAWYTQDGATARTGVLTLTVRPPADGGRARVTRARWTPARIGSDGLPTPVRGAAARRFHEDQRTLRACAGHPTG